MALATACLWGQESRLSVSHPAWNGIEIRFLTKVEPSGAHAQARLPGAVIVNQTRARHLIADAANKREFGYELWVTPDASGDTVQLKIMPLNSTEKDGYSVEPGWTLITLPNYPTIPRVKVGETVALDLLVNPLTGQKVVDYLTVARKSQPQEGATPHDFTAEDAELSMMEPHVSANGTAIAHSPVGMTGQVVWLYLPGRGRFSLSLIPNPNRGFTKNGRAAGDTFTFREGATEYRVQCSSPVAPGSGTYNLYVRHEPGWYPGPEDRFMVGSNSGDADLTIQKQ